MISKYTLQSTKLTPICTALAAGCVAVTGGTLAYNNLQAGAAQKASQEQSDRAHKERSAALVTVAKEVAAENILVSEKGSNAKIGDRINPRGSADGRSPTSTLHLKGDNTYAYLAYLDGVLQVRQVFSAKEVDAQRSANK